MTKNAVAALVVGALAMIAAACLTGITGNAPAELWALAWASIAGGLGIAVPGNVTTSSSTSSPPVAAAAPVQPAPQAATAVVTPLPAPAAPAPGAAS